MIDPLSLVEAGIPEQEEARQIWDSILEFPPMGKSSPLLKVTISGTIFPTT